MRLQVERDTFAEAVAWAARTLAPRPTNPVMAGMLLDAFDRLTLSSFDYGAAGRVTVNAAVTRPGRALVSGRLLTEIVKALPAHPVDVTLDGAKVVLRCAGSRFTLQTMPMEEYPALPALPPLIGTVGSDLFANAVWQVALAASRDATVPILSGVRVEITGRRLRMACTDRYRIAVRDLDWQPTRPDAATVALVPARAMASMARSWGSGVEVAVHLAGDGGDPVVGFECGDRLAMSRLLEDHFLDYLARFPTAYTGVAEVPTPAFTDAVRRVSLVAARHAPIMLSLRDGEIQLEAAAGEEAAALEVMPATFSGQHIRIAFNPHYLLDGLSAVDSDTVQMSFTAPGRPALLTGKSADGSAPSYRYLLMPVRLG